MYESPNLPVEILEHIVQLAARQNPGTGFNLLLVSRDVREWTEPALYDKINLRNETTKTFFRACLRRRADTTFLRRSVHELTAKTFTFGLLSVLSKIQRLSIEMLPVDPPDGTFSFQLPPVSMAKIPTLTHVIFNHVVLMKGWERRSLPPNLTHVQLYKLRTLVILPRLSECPQLAYIMVQFIRLRYHEDEDVVATIMEHISSYSDSLRTVAVVLPLVESELDLILEKEPRLLLVNIKKELFGAKADVMDCDEESLYQFGFWDEVDAFQTKRATEMMERLAVKDTTEGT